MKITEEQLLQSGFSQADLQKMKNNIASYGGSLDPVPHALANRYNASKWITVVAFTVLALTLMLASIDTIIALTATLAIVLPFIWYLAPAKLAYRSWRYRKLFINSEQGL